MRFDEIENRGIINPEVVSEDIAELLSKQLEYRIYCTKMNVGIFNGEALNFK